MFAAVVGQTWATEAHPYNIEVNGVDVIASVPMESVRVEMAGPGSNGSMSFEVWDPSSAVTIAEWDEVRFIEHAATRPLVFGGFVQSVRYRAWATAGRVIEVQCVGYGILLDRKVVPGWVKDSDNPEVSVPLMVVSVVNRCGGLVSALAAPDTIGGRLSTVSLTVPTYYTWEVPTNGFYGATGFPTDTLRGMIEQYVARGIYPTGWSGTTAISAAYWVDAYARLRFHPDPAEPDPTASYRDAAFDGGTSGLDIDLSGTYRVTELSYEAENSDRLTSAYVQGREVVQAGTNAADSQSLMADAGMIEGFYVVDAERPPFGPGFVATVWVTQATGADELGTIELSGYDLFGEYVTESFTPLSASGSYGKVTGSQVWDIITGFEGRNWVVSGDADQIRFGNAKGRWTRSAGTGWYRSPALPRAGDLETLVRDDQSTTADLVASRGAAAVGATTGRTASGSVTVGSDTPLDIWPGRCLTVTASQVAQDGSVNWRITGTAIRFESDTYRTYEISYGGTVPPPTLTRRVA